jgi:hypothetical protein
MEDSFQIAEVSDVTTGDYVSFVIADRDGRVPARISGSALGVLAGEQQFAERLEIFNAHRERIRAAAFKSRRANATLAMVLLAAADFGG